MDVCGAMPAITENNWIALVFSVVSVVSVVPSL